jgi:hypothetical protein
VADRVLPRWRPRHAVVHDPALELAALEHNATPVDVRI